MRLRREHAKLIHMWEDAEDESNGQVVADRERIGLLYAIKS